MSTNSSQRELRSQLNAKEAIRNAWLTIGDPGLAEIVASSPAVDAVTLDLQHGDIAQHRIPDLIRAIELGGASAMARLAGPDPTMIGRLLDLGISGLILPTVTTADAAADFVAWARYPPLGSRSFGPIRSGSTGDPEPLLWAMIESKEGLESAPEIAAVHGIDGLFIGPGDLGLSLGFGVGQNRTEPDFLKAVALIRAAAQASGRGLGIHSTDVGYSRQMMQEGFDLVTVWVDAGVIQSSLRAVAIGLDEGS